jgi:choline dehydrogenase-like flavoprotein
MPQAKVLLSKKHLKFSISSVHAMSSLPMGTSNKNLVNTSGQLGNFKNLYVADASILPTTIGESPQGTIMAIARNMCLKVS